ncbi:MAG: zinc ABC transporter substrate-binding protein, partial [Chitinophagaceae bacterium]|nr:zinc ABC transporter substrate-binding protein [Anaerolineae bacterium]
VAMIAEADVLFINGSALEEGLLEILEENSPVTPIVVSNGVEVLGGSHEDEHAEGVEGTEEAHDEHTVAEMIGVLGVDAICEGDEHAEGSEATVEADHEHGSCDPHFWTNPANVIIWTQNIAQALSETDPENAEIYAANAAAYITQLETLIAEIDALMATIPVEERVIVTNHDFLAYFALAHEFEIVGAVIPSISTVGQVSPQDIVGLAEIIEAEGVKAIFAENVANTALAETVAGEVGYDVAIVTLYSDALSASDGPAGTYLDYVRYNAAAIVNALKGEGS